MPNQIADRLKHLEAAQVPFEIMRRTENAALLRIVFQNIGCVEVEIFDTGEMEVSKILISDGPAEPRLGEAGLGHPQTNGMRLPDEQLQPTPICSAALRAFFAGLRG